MAQPSLFDNVRDWIGAFAFAVYLWSIRMTKEEFWNEQERDALQHYREQGSGDTLPVIDEAGDIPIAPI